MGIQEEVLKPLVDSLPAAEQEDAKRAAVAGLSFQKDAASGETAGSMLNKLISDVTAKNEVLSGEIKTLSGEKLDILTGIRDGRSLTRPQTVGLMLIGLLPSLIGGLARGKAGVSAGAQAGQLGTLTALQGFREEDKVDRELGLLELKEKSAEQKQLESQQSANLKRLTSIEDFQVKESISPRGTKINLPKTFPPGLADDIGTRVQAIGQAESIIKFIDERLPENLDETFKTFKGIQKIGKRVLKSAVFGTEETAGVLDADMSGFLVQYQSANIKGNPSDRDVKIVRDYIQGKGLLPNSIPAVKAAVRRMQIRLEDAGRDFIGGVTTTLASPGEELGAFNEAMAAAKARARPSVITDDFREGVIPPDIQAIMDKVLPKDQ